MSQARGIGAAREATVQICDGEGQHRGQGLLLVVEDEGTFVLTCHHVVAPLSPEGIYVKVPLRDGQLSDPVQARYDEDRSRPELDAVVLCLEAEYENKGPLLHELDLAYDGRLNCTVLTHVQPGSFDATVSIRAAIDIPSPVPNGAFGAVPRYKIPAAFRLANPTDARKGISGGVVVCDGVVLGLAESARASAEDRQSEVYMLPLSTWAKGWPALSNQVKPFETADPLSRSLQDYLRALSILSANLPYLTLDELLTGSRRTLRELYVPFRARAEVLDDEKNTDQPGAAASDEAPTNDAGMRSSVPKPIVVTLVDILRYASKSSAQSCVLLRGPAGAGKSTLIHHIAEHAYQRPYIVGLAQPYLPLIVRLEDLANVVGGSHEERLVNALRRAGDLPLMSNLPAGFLEQWPRRENTRWLLLFDGLDEVPAEKRADILRWLHDLLMSFGDDHPLVVVTSRPADKELSEELNPHSAAYDILPFDTDQQRDFANLWFSDTAADFLQKVERVLASSSHKEPLAMTPLLLTIAAAVYHRDGDLPEASWIELYGKFIDILFAEASRRRLAEELGPDVADVARSGLELIAQTMTEHPEQNTLGDLTKVITQHLREEFRWGNAKAEVRGAHFIEVITRRIGVLFIQGDICHWSHSSHREYLAAQALDRRLRIEQNQYSKVIGDLLFNADWYRVLLILSRIHKEQANLLQWMAAEVIVRMSGDVSLLVYDCWQLSGASVPADIQPHIVRALASGFGDRQAHNFVYERIREALLEMGNSIVETLIKVLFEYQGLQNRLQPDWKEGDTRPYIYEAPGNLIHKGLLIRTKVIKTLGEIGDERAVEPLIAIITNKDTVDSYRFDITRGARRALRCIGPLAVEPLLMRICDPAASVGNRCECLTALCVAGVRTKKVSKALGAALREGLRDNIDLLSRAIQVATILQDRAHRSLAIRALKHRDVGVVGDAARYLSEMTKDSAFPPLQNTLAKWRFKDADRFDRRWTLKHLVDALVAVGGSKTGRLILSFLENNLRGVEDSLTPGEVVQDAGEIEWSTIPPLLLQELARRIEKPSQLTPTFLVDNLLKRLASVWRPTQVRALVTAARELEAHSKTETTFARVLVEILNESTLTNGENQQAPQIHIESLMVLKALAKCQVQNFTRLVGRLLLSSEYSFERELCDALWVTEDAAAESELITKLRQGIARRRKEAEPESEEYHVLRALSTCGTKRGAREVISYVRDNPNLSNYLPEDVLCPLVRRGVLSTATLARMAQDLMGTHKFVRRQCVLAVGYLDAPRYSNLFVKVLQAEPDEEGQAYAAAFLGWSPGGRRSPVRALQSKLASTESAFVADRAAQALIRLRGTESIPLIEQAIKRFRTLDRTSGLLRAVARFRSDSTLAILMSGVPPVGRSPIVRHEILGAVGEFYNKSHWARDVVRAEFENARQGIDLGEQRDAVAVLAVRDPNWLLERAVEFYDASRLDRSAALTLIAFIRRFAKLRSLKQSGLVGILKRLICDQDLDVREATGESLVFVNRLSRQKLYGQLATTKNEWARGCAIYSMAFWDSDQRLIEKARFDQSPVIRYLANAAFTIRNKRSALKQVSLTFRTSSGVVRTSAFFSLAEQASESHVNSLYRNMKEDELPRIFLRDLADDVKRRVKDERQKRSKEEEDRFCVRARGVMVT